MARALSCPPPGSDVRLLLPVGVIFFISDFSAGIARARARHARSRRPRTAQRQQSTFLSSATAHSTDLHTHRPPQGDTHVTSHTPRHQLQLTHTRDDILYSCAHVSALLPKLSIYDSRRAPRTPSARLTAGEAAEARVESARRASPIESACGHGEPRGMVILKGHFNAVVIRIRVGYFDGWPAASRAH